MSGPNLAYFLDTHYLKLLTFVLNPCLQDFLSHYVQFIESSFPYNSFQHYKSLLFLIYRNIDSFYHIYCHLCICAPHLHTPEVLPSAEPQACNSSISAPTSPLIQTTLPSPLQPDSLTTSSLIAPPVVPTHPMQTRSKNNIHKPNHKFNFYTHLIVPTIKEPTTITQALKEIHWCHAMVKRNSDGSITRYKAGLVAKGFHQRPGLDYMKTFSPVVKPTTVRLVLTIIVSQGWRLRQLDVNNVFLQGTLQEDVYMAQPPAFVDKDRLDFVCKLCKVIYGLKQAPLACLAQRFLLKDLGPLTYFLGVKVQHHCHGLLLSQHKYIQDLLYRTNMNDSQIIGTPLSAGPPPTLAMGTLLTGPFEYRATVGSLQYLSLTKPDLSFAVNKLSQFMHKLTITHWKLVKRLLRYLSSSNIVGLLLHHQSPAQLHVFSDADWGGGQR
ncbi:hypothetical protein OIU84_008214 [Salix udensis]|uniref:Reverse transcriptase Ty1/copia-type domain-containing protein n=1 Tax=Salix udensis TaxID=889485 RepID=A0AAD6JUV2_9ROSI|nr:hypothetical protein OIU84_008214 [Salix udensis]